MKNYLSKIILYTFFITALNTMFCFGQSDNQELTEMYHADQSDREGLGNGQVDLEFASQLLARDSVRLTRVYQLSKSQALITGQDYFHAAMICQHGHNSWDADSAISYMQKSFALDSTVNTWLLAAAIDRRLVRRGEPQIYGTQFYRDEKGVWSQCTMDTTVISDEERKRFHVETLQEQREKLKQMSKISLFDLLNELKDINRIISFCRKEWLNRDKSKYNLSEAEFNDLGYYLMSQRQYTEACAIFVLNTELYPNAFNAYDSLGECLLKLGKVNEGLSAYRKSLELNPQNQNARNVLSAH
jgi:tetratricopeptide (TPR) repeat protein